MNTQTNSGSNNVAELEPTAEEALQFHYGFQRVEAKVRAVPEDRLESINLDVPGMVATVLGAYPEILALRPELAVLPNFDISQVDHLRDYALALGHTHGQFRVTGGVADNTGQLAAECMEIREQFHLDAMVLAKRKLVDEARVALPRGGNSYRMIAFDIIGLVELFLEVWPKIEGKTGLQRSEIEEARFKANKLVASIGRREQATPVVGPNSLVRQQAYTLLLRSYTDTRDAIAFVRRARGDVDQIAPSLFAGRGRSKGAEVVVPAPAATATATAQSPAEPQPGLTSIGVPVGFPGSSPLMGS